MHPVPAAGLAASSSDGSRDGLAPPLVPLSLGAAQLDTCDGQDTPAFIEGLPLRRDEAAALQVLLFGSTEGADAAARAGRYSSRGLGVLREPWTRQGLFFMYQSEEAGAAREGQLQLPGSGAAGSGSSSGGISDLSYGLVQSKGGPCGPLACVQAWTMARLADPSQWTEPMRAANKAAEEHGSSSSSSSGAGSTGGVEAGAGSK